MERKVERCTVKVREVRRGGCVIPPAYIYPALVKSEAKCVTCLEGRSVSELPFPPIRSSTNLKAQRTVWQSGRR